MGEHSCQGTGPSREDACTVRPRAPRLTYHPGLVLTHHPGLYPPYSDPNKHWSLVDKRNPRDA